MKRIAIFASGSGTNAKKIIEYFDEHPLVKVELIVCNNPKAGVIAIATEKHIPYQLISRADLYETDQVVNLLRIKKIDFIVLAGFLLKIPENILNAFPDRIVNIHPALLPGFGGKGMYGRKVHEQVAASKETTTGITIHYLNKNFDEGKIIFQTAIEIGENESIDSIANKVQKLEHYWYPIIIERLLVS
jgi:phosphoribosylglycinamide formyltransferase-1